jgi:hypothetical protein
MSKPLIIELPNCQGICPEPNQVVFRVHDYGQYLFPLGTRNSQSANFDCSRCGNPVRWLKTKQAAVFSCHCFIAVCGEPNHPVFVGNPEWEIWIEEFFRWANEQQQSQAN